MKKLLIVDDNPLNIFTLKNHLHHFGLDTDIATCAAEAYTYHQKNCYDIILLDYHLPDATGLDIARYIIQYDRKRQQKTTIISISADSSQEIEEALLATGVDLVLHKPLTQSQLLNALATYIPDMNLAVSTYIAPAPAVIPGVHFHELKKWLPADRDEACEFIAEFIRTTRQGIDILQQAASRRDLSKIILEAHRLKTPPKAFGMYQLAAQLEALQQAAQDGHTPSQMEIFLNSLQECLCDIEQQLGEWLCTIPRTTPEKLR